MNEAGRERLVAAALNGVKQIFGGYRNQHGVCALGALGVSADGKNERDINRMYGLDNEPKVCDLCNLKTSDEGSLIVHLNDIHLLDFLTIARKV